MAAAAISTYPGFEDLAAKEVKELTGVKAVATAGKVSFAVKRNSDLCRFCYLSQSASSVFLNNSAIPFGIGKREYSVYGQNDIEGCLAYLLLRAAAYNPDKEFLLDPFTRSGAIAIEAAFFSSGFSVNHYRKSALSAALSRLAVDCGKAFSAADSAAGKKIRKGILASSPSMPFLRSAEKNAKVAGVNKLIRFSRLDIEWLDAKLGEHSVDLVVSYPPQFSGRADDFAVAENRKLLKVYGTFFLHADYFMKRAGRIVLLVNKATEAAIFPIAAKFFKPTALRKIKLNTEDFELVKWT